MDDDGNNKEGVGGKGNGDGNEGGGQQRGQGWHGPWRQQHRWHGNGDKDDGQAMATRAMGRAKATMWMMVTATRLAGKEEGKGNGGRDDGNGDEGGRQQRGQWQGWQERWQLQQGWRASNGNGDKEGVGDGNKGGGQVTAMAMKRAMATAMRVVGNKEGNGDGQQERQ